MSDIKAKAHGFKSAFNFGLITINIHCPEPTNFLRYKIDEPTNLTSTRVVNLISTLKKNNNNNNMTMYFKILIVGLQVFLYF